MSVEVFSGVAATSALALALAACAGLRAWLPLFLAGLLSRFGLFSFGASYGFLGSKRALVIFGLASLIEILADKVPAIDHALDLVSTVVRPAAGALIAASVFGRITDPILSLALGIALGAPVALLPHAGKATLRAASTVTTAGMGNPFLSTAEDLSTLVLFALALLAPLIVVGLMLVVLVLVLQRMLRRSGEAVQPG